VLTRRLHAYACEGADENSWQSRPRHAVLSPTLGRLPPPRETAADLARVMLLLDASTIARNVGRDQRAVARIPTWAAAPTALLTHCQRGRPQDFVAGTRVPRSGLPRVFVRALASISKACKCLVVAAAAHALCAPHSQPPPCTRLVCGNRSTCLRPSARGTPCATGAPCRGRPGCGSSVVSIAFPIKVAFKL
jgi:hypothetical protein